jgi:hypothetical protein
MSNWNPTSTLSLAGSNETAVPDCIAAPATEATGCATASTIHMPKRTRHLIRVLSHDRNRHAKLKRLMIIIFPLFSL